MPRRKPKPGPRRRAAPARPRTDVERIARQAAQRREACAAKVRYDTESEARSFAIMHAPGRGPRARPYLCDICDGWHLTRG